MKAIGSFPMYCRSYPLDALKQLRDDELVLVRAAHYADIDVVTLLVKHQVVANHCLRFSISGFFVSMV